MKNINTDASIDEIYGVLRLFTNAESDISSVTSHVERPVSYLRSDQIIQTCLSINPNQNSSRSSTTFTNDIPLPSTDGIRSMANNKIIKKSSQQQLTPTAQLFYASARGQVELIDNSIREGANANYLHYLWNSSLHIAAATGQIFSIEALIKNGVDANIQGLMKVTPLHDAVSSGKVNSVAALIRLGADKEAKDIFDNTPLHEAAKIGHFDAAKVLVKMGANKGPLNADNDTPIQTAAINGKTELIAFLLSIEEDKVTAFKNLQSLKQKYNFNSNFDDMLNSVHSKLVAMISNATSTLQNTEPQQLHLKSAPILETSLSSNGVQPNSGLSIILNAPINHYENTHISTKVIQKRKIDHISRNLT
jgi:ankyrin repeat protein